MPNPVYVNPLLLTGACVGTTPVLNAGQGYPFRMTRDGAVQTAGFTGTVGAVASETRAPGGAVASVQAGYVATAPTLADSTMDVVRCDASGNLVTG